MSIYKANTFEESQAQFGIKTPSYKEVLDAREALSKNEPNVTDRFNSYVDNNFWWILILAILLIVVAILLVKPIKKMQVGRRIKKWFFKAFQFIVLIARKGLGIGVRIKKQIIEMLPYQRYTIILLGFILIVLVLTLMRLARVL